MPSQQADSALPSHTPPPTDSTARTVIGPLRREVQRKAVHALPGLIPFIMLGVYHEDPLPAWNLAVVLGVVALLTAVGYRYRDAIARSGESWTATCLGYPLAPTLTLCLFPARAELAAVVLVVLAFGDAAAGLGGLLLGGPRLPWNRAKSWVGLSCFAAAALPAAAFIYWAEAKPTVPVYAAIICGGAAAFAGAAAESLPMRGSDNVRVGLAAALGVIVADAVWSSA